MTRAGTLRLLTLLLLAFALYRGVALLLAQPLLALANNYDMIRVQGCIDVFPLRPAHINPLSANPQAPLERYAFRKDIPLKCFFTTESLFARAAKPLMKAEAAHSADGAASVRWVGLVKVLCLFALATGFTLAWWRRGREGSALLNALVMAALLMDPAITLYLNGFYAEYAVVICLYAVVAGTALLLGGPRAPGKLGLLLLGVAVFALVCTKVQHAGLGLAIAALILLPRFFGVRIALRVPLAVAAAGVLGLALQLHQLGKPGLESMRQANMTSTVFSSLLPLADDPQRVAGLLGLPARCGEYAGMTWYFAPVAEDPARHPCPEVFRLSHLRLLGLAFAEPALLQRFIGGGLEYLRPWVSTRYMFGAARIGVVEGQSMADLPAGWFSWSRVLDSLPSWLIRMLVLGPAAVLSLMLLLRRAGGAAPAAVLSVLAFLPYPVMIAVVFGNGYVDAAKQMHLVFGCVIAFWMLLAGRLARHAYRRGEEVPSHGG